MCEAGRSGAAATFPVWRRAADAGLRFRPAGSGDLPFLFQVYASTRIEELAPLPWTAAQKDEFLLMQARMQHAGYATAHPQAERWLIERDGEGVGRVYLDRRPAADHILDIAFLPAFRSRGLGGALLADLIDAATGEGKPVTLQVAGANPARRLYERLGFETVEERLPYLLMRRAC